jgi:hypothetical protein
VDFPYDFCAEGDHMPFVRAGRPGLLGSVSRASVVGGTTEMTANAVNRAAERKAAQATAYTMQVPTTTSVETDDLVARIEQLVRLRDRGALSDEEFRAAKALLFAG